MGAEWSSSAETNKLNFSSCIKMRSQVCLPVCTVGRFCTWYLFTLHSLRRTSSRPGDWSYTDQYRGPCSQRTDFSWNSSSKELWTVPVLMQSFMRLQFCLNCHLENVLLNMPYLPGTSIGFSVLKIEVPGGNSFAFYSLHQCLAVFGNSQIWHILWKVITV